MEATGVVEEKLRWHWRWEDLCGPEGLAIWSPQTRDIGLCFEQLCLEAPALVLLAVSSAYYFGRQTNYVRRARSQLFAIKFRCIVVTLLALMPLIQVYVYMNSSVDPIEKIAYFLSAVEGIAWFTHLGYCLVLRNSLGVSPRGPLLMGVIWTLLSVLTVVSLRTHFLIWKLSFGSDYSATLAYYFSISRGVLQLLYMLSLLPSEGDSVLLNNEQVTGLVIILLFINYLFICIKINWFTPMNNVDVKLI